MRWRLSWLAVLGSFAACGFDPPADVQFDADVSPDAPDAPPPDAVECSPNTSVCSGSTLVVCDSAGTKTETPCAFGCGDASDRCADLDPANDLASFLDQAADALALTLTGNAVIDTSAETVTNGDGTPIVVASSVVAAVPVPILVVAVRSADIENVTVRGTRALAIVADGDVIIRGALSVSAVRETPGAGAVPGTDGACNAGQGTQASNGTAGGGGGGFGTAGGRGGNGGSGQGGAGGVANGASTLVPLRGGCPGAYAFGTVNPNPDNGKPGAAGGAIQVSARGRVRLEAGASITANGGGAKGWTGGLITCQMGPGVPPACHQGSGGGAGGGILLEGASVEFAATSGLFANGGAGHCGFSGFAPDGAGTTTPAAGSVCTSLSGVGNGGSGAAGASSAVNGGNGSSNGGGGGGGAGRIRVNLPAGATFDGATTSPQPTVGAVRTR